MCEKWTLTESLFLEMLSLLSVLAFPVLLRRGIPIKNACISATACIDQRFGRDFFVNFPVIFPDIREFEAETG